LTLFDAAVRSVLKHEGGYINDSRDSGGETAFGISKRSYPHLDIQALTPEDAIDIYWRDYWSQVPEHLPDDVRWFAFDVCVHSGGGRMREFLNQTTDLLELAAIRLKFLASLDGFNVFGRGWVRRVAGVMQDIQDWKATRPSADDQPQEASTVVLHGFPLAIRWAILTQQPAVLRGHFVWRARGAKLDVRAIK
jgi:lysozyme family protein